MSTGIEWTDETWNPVVGCERVSPGCARCYAKTLHDLRHKAHGEGKAVAPQYAHPFETVQLMLGRLAEPLRWRTPRRIFVNSVSDLFHDDIPDAFIAAVFGVMGYARRHTFQVLTKRPARALELLTRLGAKGGQAWCHGEANTLFCTQARSGLAAWERAYKPAEVPWPLPNVWLGVSVENQRFADERIPLLLQTPAANRFLSCEPLLGPVDLTRYLDPTGVSCPDVCPDDRFVNQDSYDTTEAGDPRCRHCGEVATWTGYDEGIDWVIAGGESGKDARVMQPQWVQSIRDQCAADGVAFFFKQWGGERDKRGHDAALLDGVRHNAFPETAAAV